MIAINNGEGIRMDVSYEEAALITEALRRYDARGMELSEQMRNQMQVNTTGGIGE